MKRTDFERAKKINQEITTVERALREVETDTNIYELSAELFQRQRKEKIDYLNKRLAELSAEFLVL